MTNLSLRFKCVRVEPVNVIEHQVVIKGSVRTTIINHVYEAEPDQSVD
jgi:hypothetical protein